jgi:hypothetical protein
LATPTPKPTSPFKKQTKTAVKATSPFLKSTKKEDPWAPVLSFGQSVIDTLSTPLYAVEGGINAALKGKNPIQGAAENAASWTQGKRPVTGAELLKTAGIESNFWTSLAADVILDPLTYTPGVVFTAPLKAAGIASKAAVKAGSLAAKGEIGFKNGTKVYSFNKKPLTSKAWSGAVNDLTKITPATEAQKSFLAKYANKQQATKEMLQKRTYSTITIAGNRSTGQAVNDVLASAFSAGKQAMVGTLLSEGAKRTLRKYAAKSNRIVKKNAKQGGNIADQVIEESIIQAPKLGKAVEETKAPKPAPTPKTVAEQIKLPVLADTAPKTQEVRDLAKVAPNAAEAKVLDKVLGKIERFSKDAKVTAVAAKDNIGEIKKILSPTMDATVSAVNKMDKNIFNRIKDAIVRKDGASAFSFYRYFADSTVDEQRSWANNIGGMRLVDANGNYTTIAKVARATVDDKTIPVELQQQAAKTLELNFLTLGTPNGLEKYRYDKIAKLLGKEFADNFKKTGALNPSKTTDKAALDALIKQLPQGDTVTKKSYTGFDNLIEGLRSGDIVDTESLLKIIKALDPEGKLDTQVEKAMAKDPYTGLKDLLIKNAYSVIEMRQRMDKLNPEKMFKGTGAGFSDTQTVYYTQRINDEIPPLPEAELTTRRVVAKEISELTPNSVTNAATGISRVVSAQFDYIENNKLNVLEISNRGDAVARSKSGKMDAQSKAKRELETNEHFGTGLASVFAGRGTYRSNKAFEKSLKNDTKFVPANRLDDLEGQMNIADNLLLVTLGTRMIAKQQAKDALKGVPAHYVYLHVGDFAGTALKIGGKLEELANRAIFPGTGNKYDGISFISLMDSIRMMLEGIEKNLMPTEEAITARLMDLGRSQEEKMSPGYLRELPLIAAGIAKELQKGEVLKELLDRHTNKLLGATEDAIGPARTMTREIYDILHNAWKVNNDQEINSPAARMDAVRQFLNEFAYTSHIFDQNYGPAGEAVFKAVAMMFVKDGLVDGAKILPTDVEEWAAFREGLNNYFKHTAPDQAAPAGREHLPFPSDATQARRAQELKQAMNDYESHMDLIPTLKTKEEVRLWVVERKRLQRELDAIRPKAWAAWQQTYHWVGGSKKWIETERYKHSLEVEKATKKQIILTVEGPVNLGPLVTDTKATTKAPKQTKAQEKAGIDARDKATRKKADKLAVGAKEDGNAKALANADQIKEAVGDDDLAFAARLQQDSFNNPLLAANIPTYFFRGRWTKVRNPAQGEEHVSTLRRIGEKLSATFGKSETQQIAASNESTMMFAIQSVAHGAALVRDRYLGIVTEQQMAQGFRHALHQTDIEDLALLNLDETTIGLIKDLRGIFDTVIEELKSSNIPNHILDAAFQHYGITAKRGFMAAKDTTNKALILHNLPFMEMPEDLTPELARQWNERAQAFKEADIDPFVMLANFAGAIQFAKTEQAIGQQFGVRFGHLAEGLTKEQAIKEGYVQIKQLPGTGIDLTAGIPEGTLFHPYYAEQFAAMNRNWSGIYEKGMPDFLRVILDFTGILKGTQTLLRPGHHMTNIIGDTTIAILRGARDPGTWARSMRLAYKHASEDIKANVGKSKLENAMKQITRRLEGVGGRKYVESEETKALTVVINGKKTAYSDEELIKMLEDNGVIINNIFYDQYQGLYEAAVETSVRATSEADKELNKKIMFSLKEFSDKASTGFQKVVKPFGDAASYYGNISRTATALDVMRKGNFRSVEDMMGAVNDVVNRYHPTIQSLSAWERRYPRAIFTYYTWLRVAHNAMIDLALNHTSAMTFYSKAQYNKAEEQGFQPTSIGNPWGNQQTTPGYINYSVYGPTYNGPRGEMLVKPAIAPLDVLDTWNIIYDPAYTMDQNTARNIGQLGQGVLGKNVNILAQLPLELLTKTSPTTGKPSQVKDAQSLMDRLFSMTGFYTLAKGTGLYTPPNKGETAANPLTQRDRDILLQNWLLGLKQADVNTPVNVKNAQSEQSARYNAWLKNYGQK